MKINYRKFIEDNFAILDRDRQIPVPFRFNPVQIKYYKTLFEENPEFEGVRDIVLKARQEGISSFVLALFAVDFIVRPYSVSVCISHRKDSTDLLFKKVKFYIDSYITRLAKSKGIDYDSLSKQFLKSDNRNLIENATNNAVFYIGTAGAKVGGRGGSCRNILFSECAFYQDTELITAQEIVLGTAQQVPQGVGMIFIESTANGVDNYYQREWERSMLPVDADGHRPSMYKPRFFGWSEFYTKEWVQEKRREFPNEQMWKQEYPNDPDEAFITSGTPYFNNQLLNAMLAVNAQPVTQGKIAPDGTLDVLTENAPTKLYRELEWGEQFVVFGDPAESHDFCAAVACSKKHYDMPMVYNEVVDSPQFGYNLYAMCKYIFQKTGMWPKLAVERNTGQATIFVLKNLNYPDLFRMVDFTSTNSMEKGEIGWVTTGHISGGELQGTRRKMLDDLALALKQGVIHIYDKVQIKQMMAFMIVKGRAQAKANKKDDLVMATAGCWQIQQLTPSVNFGDFDVEEFKKEKSKWRFR